MSRREDRGAIHGQLHRQPRIVGRVREGELGPLEASEIERAGRQLPGEAAASPATLEPAQQLPRDLAQKRRARRRLGEEVARADLAVTPLHQVLEFKLGVAIDRASETVSAVRLGPREARRLGCRAGAAAFESERVSYERGGGPIVFDRVFIPGDRFRITRELHYDGASA